MRWFELVNSETQCLIFDLVETNFVEALDLLYMFLDPLSGVLAISLDHDSAAHIADSTK